MKVDAEYTEKERAQMSADKAKEFLDKLDYAHKIIYLIKKAGPTSYHENPKTDPANAIVSSPFLRENGILAVEIDHNGIIVMSQLEDAGEKDTDTEEVVMNEHVDSQRGVGKTAGLGDQFAQRETCKTESPRDRAAITCDQVCWMMDVFERYLPKVPIRVSQEREMKKYGMLYEIMDVAGLVFQDEAAISNGTPNPVRKQRRYTQGLPDNFPESLVRASEELRDRI